MTAWRIPIARPDLPPLEEYVDLLRGVWETRRLSNHGPLVQRLEAEAAELLGCGVRAVSSGDAALVCAIAALDLPPGTKALVPSFTFASTVQAILWNRLVPVFLEVGPGDAFVPELQDVLAAVDTTGAKLAVLTHTFGFPAPIDFSRIRAGAGGLRVVYDAAHALGATVDGRSLASFGNAAAVSLSGTKLATTGEGGFVVSRDEALLERVEYVRNYGFLGDYVALRPGINGKMSELHAALGLCTLPRLRANLSRRRAIARRYREALVGSGVFVPSENPGASWKDMPLVFSRIGDRGVAEERLAERRIETKRYFEPCHEMPAFRGFGKCAAVDDLRGPGFLWPLHRTESLAARILCVPIHGSLLDVEVDEIAGVVLESLRAGRAA